MQDAIFIVGHPAKNELLDFGAQRHLEWQMVATPRDQRLILFNGLVKIAQRAHLTPLRAFVCTNTDSDLPVADQVVSRVR